MRDFVPRYAQPGTHILGRSGSPAPSSGPSWPRISRDGRLNAYLGTFKPWSDLGEEDEHGIEDTIHTKASLLIVQKHASDINRRAEERNALVLEKMDRSQVIDFACHSFFAGAKRGPAASLYSRGSALALLELTSNFTRDWTKQKGINALNQAFDWVETHADTNPGRDFVAATFLRVGPDNSLAIDSISLRLLMAIPIDFSHDSGR